jgi:hypothetical protein
MTPSTLIQKMKYSSIKYGCCDRSLIKKTDKCRSVFHPSTAEQDNRRLVLSRYRPASYCAAGISSERSIRIIQLARCVCSVALNTT